MLYQGSCHCGAIAFEVEGTFTQAIDCNCSLCRRRGGLLAFVPAGNLRLRTPVERLSTYRFNKQVIQHHFCSTCGTAPFSEGEGKDGEKSAMINLRCIPEFDLDSVEVVKFNGISH
ncbi:GFA family protein [Rhizobium sp. KVB221]|uniref:GFA family protein n=1 Tax=Rhizobium setariae TaxID=2801340 RepID=A0A936YNE8_9HYPH|nr:GFA family protein [Rhizobium setariae]MBL0371912.1 GFA family protein [Rhizobium setariae]